MDKNNIDIMFNQVMKGKNKPIGNERHPKNYKVKNLTHLKNNKTIGTNNTNNTKKIVKMGKDMIDKMNLGNNVEIEKIIGIDIDNNSSNGNNSSNSINNKQIVSGHTTNNINTTNTIQKILNISNDDFKNLPQDKIKEIMSLLDNYIKMDKTYRIKHEELKKLYTEYSNLYNEKINNGMENGKMKNGKMENNKIEDKEHQEMLKTIHNEMKDNNTNLYRSRLMILKKIKDEPQIEPVIKNKICGKLLVIFKSQPKTEYKQLPMLQENNEKITVKELDHAYLQKHNELMTVYKAYQTLFSKTVNYKDELDKYKQLPTGSLISRNHMDKLLTDQGFVMNMIDKMQDQLIDKNIISNTDKVPVNPVAGHSQNLETFNNTMRDQIKHIIDRRVEVKPMMQTKIENLLSKYQDCDSNDKFCHAGRKLLLIKKM